MSIMDILPSGRMAARQSATFFDLYDNRTDGSKNDNQQPLQCANGRGLEYVVENRQVGKRELQQYHCGTACPGPWIGKCTDRPE